MLAGARDDRREHRQRRLEAGHEGAVEGVAEYVGAGVDLGDARVRARDVPRAEAAGRDDLGAEAAACRKRLRRRPARRSPRVAFSMRSGTIRLEHAVALVAQQALEPEARQASPISAASSSAASHRARRPSGAGRRRPRRLHVDLRARALSAAADSSSRVDRALDRDDHAAEAGDARELRGLHRPDDLVRDQHVRDACVDHRGCFPDRRRREADGAGVQLHPADDRALVDLRVRSQRRREAGHAARHLGDVALDHARGRGSAPASRARRAGGRSSAEHSAVDPLRSSRPHACRHFAPIAPGIRAVH